MVWLTVAARPPISPMVVSLCNKQPCRSRGLSDDRDPDAPSRAHSLAQHAGRRAKRTILRRTIREGIIGERPPGMPPKHAVQACRPGRCLEASSASSGPPPQPSRPRAWPCATIDCATADCATTDGATIDCATADCATTDGATIDGATTDGATGAMSPPCRIARSTPTLRRGRGPRAWPEPEWRMSNAQDACGMPGAYRGRYPRPKCSVGTLAPRRDLLFRPPAGASGDRTSGPRCRGCFHQTAASGHTARGTPPIPVLRVGRPLVIPAGPACRPVAPILRDAAQPMITAGGTALHIHTFVADDSDFQTPWPRHAAHAHFPSAAAHAAAHAALPPMSPQQAEFLRYRAIQKANEDVEHEQLARRQAMLAAREEARRPWAAAARAAAAAAAAASAAAAADAAAAMPAPAPASASRAPEAAAPSAPLSPSPPARTAAPEAASATILACADDAAGAALAGARVGADGPRARLVAVAAIILGIGIATAIGCAADSVVPCPRVVRRRRGGRGWDGGRRAVRRCAGGVAAAVAAHRFEPVGFPAGARSGG
ncbi:hypothetical protein CXG81DRAFT_19862 [Caulochytrium protostelioides]|uniref:Uncharacterized protein n=1 Tax=Caulochytrium protostelioides TaxID=1555241 RepID=A0A4P9X4Y7_9FUNG|nr:hypothetical protein CXG81DRAFT_19862 [Caulochytrium protostelioides]|eukprot:RKP00132.1 hypothetical protein CXG81DRAFT_19862 [Caulochytrium protostelioides]